MEQNTNEIKAEPIDLKSKGYYSLNVYKADGSEVLDKRVTNSENVVTYEGAYDMFFGGQIFATMYANIGTGTTERTRSSTGLDNRFAANSGGDNASREGNEVDNGDGTSTLTLTRVMPFTLGDTTGTFSEVGMSRGSSGSIFIAGQLIKDEFGNPTTITVLEDEQLVVTYTLELTVPNGQQGAKNIGTGTVTTPEGPVNYTVYAQPFFATYADIGSSFNTRVNFNGGVSFIRSASSPSSGNPVLFTAGSPSISRSSGTVTLVTGGNTASPSSFSMTDLKYQLFGEAGASDALRTSIDPVTHLRPSNGLSYQYVLLEYDTPINKDNTRSYKAQLTLTYNI